MQTGKARKQAYNSNKVLIVKAGESESRPGEAGDWEPGAEDWAGRWEEQGSRAEKQG